MQYSQTSNFPSAILDLFFSLRYDHQRCHLSRIRSFFCITAIGYFGSLVVLQAKRCATWSESKCYIKGDPLNPENRFISHLGHLRTMSSHVPVASERFDSHRLSATGTAAFSMVVIMMRARILPHLLRAFPYSCHVIPSSRSI